MCAIIQKRNGVDPILPDVQVCCKRKIQHFFVSRRKHILQEINQKINSLKLLLLSIFHYSHIVTIILKNR